MEYSILRAPTLQQVLASAPPKSVTFDANGGKRFTVHAFNVFLRKDKVKGQSVYSFKAILTSKSMTLEHYRQLVKAEHWDVEGSFIPAMGGGVIRER